MPPDHSRRKANPSGQGQRRIAGVMRHIESHHYSIRDCAYCFVCAAHFAVCLAVIVARPSKCQQVNSRRQPIEAAITGFEAQKKASTPSLRRTDKPRRRRRRLGRKRLARTRTIPLNPARDELPARLILKNYICRFEQSHWVSPYPPWPSRRMAGNSLTYLSSRPPRMWWMRCSIWLTSNPATS